MEQQSSLESGPAQIIGMAAAREGRNSRKGTIGDAEKDPQWQWPMLEKWFSRMEGKWKTRDTTDELEGENKLREDTLKCPFKVTTHIREPEDGSLQDKVSVTLRSHHLIHILQECYAGIEVRNLCCEEPEVDVKDLFIAWPKLCNKYRDIAHRAPSLSGCILDIDDIEGEVRNGGISVAAAKTEEKPVEDDHPMADGSPPSDVKDDGLTETEEKPVQDDHPMADGPPPSDVKEDDLHIQGEVRDGGISAAAAETEEKPVQDDHPMPVDDGPPQSDVKDDDLSAIHLHHLLRFLLHHFKDVFSKLSWMTEKGVVSYDMLWTFLKPGVTVRWTCNISGQDCFGRVHSRGKYRKNPYRSDDNGFAIQLWVRNFNAESYRACVQNYKISEFDGEVPFTSLAVCPLSFFHTSEKQCLEERLMERGRKFYEVAMKEPYQFMQFKGSMGYYVSGIGGCFQLRRVNADGRVMVDLLSTAKINPDWPLGNAQPPSELLRGDRATTVETVDSTAKRPSDEKLKWAPAVVFGFSFGLKKWGCFELDGLKDITFNDEAYEQLVMRTEKQKDMLRRIVSTRLACGDKGGGDGWKKTKSVDVVAHKGEGCVILCYGPPGTGKTLTAETLAETLHRPLWAISAFELGEEPGDLERNLRQVLSTAFRWHAVVLLDEADCYLERRSFDVDIKHNLMTGVFLRLLEYYGGVLFLTTNRVRAFDTAFLSRISLCLHYPPLADVQRRVVWRTLLERASATGSGPAGAVLDADIQGFLGCGRPLNGREIRNIVVLAVSWASSLSEPLGISHVRDALELVVGGAQELTKDLGEPY